MTSPATGNHRLQRFILRLQVVVSLITLPAVFAPRIAVEKLSWFGGFGQPPMLPILIYLTAGGCAVYLILMAMLWIISGDVIRYRPLVIFASWGYLLCGPLYLWIDYQAGLPRWWVLLDSLSCFVTGVILLWAAHGRTR